jgi:predicted RNA-binding Zn-ribbon protein involved in translation (DUF1610 family)
MALSTAHHRSGRPLFSGTGIDEDGLPIFVSLDGDTTTHLCEACSRLRCPECRCGHMTIAGRCAPNESTLYTCDDCGFSLAMVGDDLVPN